MRRLLIALLATAAAAVPAGCGASDGAAGGVSGGAGLKVVATTTQLQDFTRAIGGDRIELTGILKPNVDPHDYEPSPADVDAIARADLLIINGVGLERWLDDTVRSAGFDGITVDSSSGVPIRKGGGEQAAGDPHIWQNPRNARLMVANIERALARADSADARDFRRNLDAYDAKLDALDAEVARQIDGLANRRLVTNHDAFGYYIDRYHLDLVGSIIPSFDTSAELSAKGVAELVAKIRATGVKAVFSETSVPPRTAETIAGEAHVRVVEGESALYGDTLGPAGSDGATYLQMIEHNTRTIVANLGST